MEVGVSQLALGGLDSEQPARETGDSIETAATGQQTRYAAVYWVCDPNWSKERFEVALGWFVHPRASGSWGFACESFVGGSTATGPWPAVEEPRGILFPAATDSDRVTDVQVERLLSDHLLLFAHRVLFGQARTALPEVKYDGSPVDLLLVFGPTLPKFVGRLCYTHMNRKKTVAVIGPDIGRDGPGVAGSEWEEHPVPGYWEDCAVRRWRVRPGGAERGNNRTVLAFEIVVPVGDGIVGNPISASPFATKLWKEKACLVKKVLASEPRLPIPKLQAIYVPRGIALAAKRALLHWPTVRADERIQQIPQNHPELQMLFRGIENGIAMKVPKLIPQKLKPIVLAEAFALGVASCSQDAGKPRATSQLAQRNKRDTQGEARKAVDEAIQRVQRDYGDFGAFNDLDD